MITKQEFYNKACHSLRTYGNQYGSYESRGWGWCNPDDPSQRCAIAQFVAGNTEWEIHNNLIKLVVDAAGFNPLVKDITHLFDFAPTACNNKEMLETELKALAEKHKLSYNAPITSKSEEIHQSETVEV